MFCKNYGRRISRFGPHIKLKGEFGTLGTVKSENVWQHHKVCVEANYREGVGSNTLRKTWRFSPKGYLDYVLHIRTFWLFASHHMYVQCLLEASISSVPLFGLWRYLVWVWGRERNKWLFDLSFSAILVWIQVRSISKFRDNCFILSASEICLFLCIFRSYLGNIMLYAFDSKFREIYEEILLPEPF